MRKIFAALLISITLIMTGCNGGDEKDSGNDDTLMHQRKFVVGLDDAYAPFGFRNEDNELIGFDIDLAKEIAERLDIEFEFKAIDWNNKEEELESGKIDIIWSGFNITPERKEYVIYSKPYMINRQVILVPKGGTKNIVSAEDLAGKIVGTQLGAPSDEYINRGDHHLRNIFGKLITYDNYKHAFKALENGEVEAIICDELVVRYEMNRHPNKFEMIEATVGPVTEIGIGFRKEDTELRDNIQNALSEVIKDGTAKKISEEWFGADLIQKI